MVQFHINPHAAMLPLQNVFGTPDTHRTVIRTGCQILPIIAEVQARDISTVALQNKNKIILWPINKSRCLVYWISVSKERKAVKNSKKRIYLKIVDIRKKSITIQSRKPHDLYAPFPILPQTFQPQNRLIQL